MNMKRKKEQEQGGQELEQAESNKLKYSQIDEKTFLVKGQAGYETIFVKKPFKEGIYLIGLSDVSKKQKKFNQKASFRVGTYVQTDDEDNNHKFGVFSLGSCGNSIAIRSTDKCILKGGEVKLRPDVDVRDVEQDTDEESEKESPKNELVFDLYMLLNLESPKNPELMKYYKDKFSPEELSYSERSFISYFSSKEHLGTVYNLREGTYFMGLSLYMESNVRLDVEADPDSLLQSLQLQGPREDQMHEEPVAKAGERFSKECPPDLLKYLERLKERRLES